MPPALAESQPNAGGGTLSGRIDFDGIGISPINTPCRAASFSLAAEATIVLANGAGSQGAWVMKPPFGALLAGSGQSSCENVVVSGGEMELETIDVVNPVTSARLRCTDMHGAYTRQHMDFAAVLGGFCAIDAHNAGKVAIYVRAHMAPAPETGNGVTANITAATINGEFTVVPA